jgi:hypothetical protein
MRGILFGLLFFVPASAFAQANTGPYLPNAYGPGVNSDAAGRPFTWQPAPDQQLAGPLSTVLPDAFGPGIGMDQNGKPVQAVPQSSQQRDNEDK